ncbi:MAG: hypothetical protein ABEJ92_09800 [Halobacteriales archaeon]
MELDHETVTEIAVSVGGVALFIAALVVVGLTYNDDGFSSTGGLVLVGLVVAFILGFTAIGWWLSGRQA